MRTRGLSLIELVLYLALLAVLTTLVSQVLVANRRDLERPTASFAAQGSVLAVQGMLQRDLEETDRSTVRFHPAPLGPGLSLISARTGRSAGEELVLKNGLPLWQKYVYYLLEPDPQAPGTGQLVRFEGALGGKPTTVPRPSALPPARAAAAPGSRRVLARGLALPGQAVEPLKLTLGPYGGFRGAFRDARGDESATDFLRHPLVLVEVSARQVSPATGKLTFLRYPIVVLPRN